MCLDAGEASLQATIVNMAQDYVSGSNNINLLLPNGQFGTRLQNGKDAASPRYIFTELSPLTPLLVVPDDAPLLRYLTEDGVPIEPQYYVPVLPLILCNGTEGIGSGFSTSVPSHDPRAVAAAVLRLMDGEEPGELVPWYRGHQGAVERTGDRVFTSHGVWRKTGEDTVEVSELPVGKSTDAYKEFLEGAVIDGAAEARAKRKQFLAGYENYSTDAAVRFVVRWPKGKLCEETAEAELHLTSTLTTSNMHLFDAAGRMHKYADTREILEAFCAVRLALYGRRRAYLLKKLQRELDVLCTRARFVDAIMAGTLDIFRKSKDAVDGMLEAGGYRRFSAAPDLLADDPDAGGDYAFLTDMKIHSFTAERIEALQAQAAKKGAELEEVRALSEKDMWRRDLRALVEAYGQSLAEFEARAAADRSAEPQKASKRRRRA